MSWLYFLYMLQSCRHFVIAMEDRLLIFGINYEIPRGISSHLGGALQYLLQEVHKVRVMGSFYFSNIFTYSLNIHTCI